MICGGGPIGWECRKEFHNLSDQELEMVSLEQLEQVEFERMKYNAFKVCNEFTLRIDGSPAQGGFMKAFLIG